MAGVRWAVAMCTVAAVAGPPSVERGVLRLPLVRTATRPPAHLVARHARRRRLDESSRAFGADMRGRRRALRASLEGDLRLGYFSTIVGLGTPAQHFELIVDTGSSITTVPCAGCTQCGRHRKFDARRSTTASACTGDSCAFSITYQEGSAYRGVYMNDWLSLGTAAACAAVPFTFGCSGVETGLFRSQQADGILGLAPGSAARRTVHDALVARSIVRNVFSLCIAPQAGRGFLEFGDRAPTRRALQPQPPSSRLVSSRLHLVSVRGVRLGEGLPSLGEPASALLDSGTTFVYVGARLFAPLFRAVSAVEIGACGLAAAPPPRRDEICVRPASERSAASMAERLDRCFAHLIFDLSRGELHARPSHYWFNEGAGGAREGVWCMGVFRNHNEQLVLGASVLQDHLVTIDRERMRVTFTPHRCTDDSGEGAADDARARAAAANKTRSAPAADGGGACAPSPADRRRLPPPESGDAHSGARAELSRPGGRCWAVYASVTALCACLLLCAACGALERERERKRPAGGGRCADARGAPCCDDDTSSSDSEADALTAARPAPRAGAGGIARVPLSSSRELQPLLGV
ncbi:hypothetical protein KFE25_009295 [Diacronema lutheri]|uniref:Peptidase A1 domain-containing protein n=1 Tax=Diacronema lutheri TaxID=2081491 RepID=A0A8J6CFN1_DIALT|nr:hypothetical protein KFE25_009295 [Diacronema lutheri]